MVMTLRSPGHGGRSRVGEDPHGRDATRPPDQQLAHVAHRLGGEHDGRASPAWPSRSYTASSSPSGPSTAHGPSPVEPRPAARGRCATARPRRRRRRRSARSRAAPRGASSSASTGERGLGGGEAADRGAPQVAQVRAAAAAAGRGRRRACACTCPTSSARRSRTRAGRRSARRRSSCTVTGRGFALDLDALAGQLVQAPAVDLHRADHRRHLHDRPGQVLGTTGAHVHRASRSSMSNVPVTSPAASSVDVVDPEHHLAV